MELENIKLKALLFDLDGTLVNTAEANYRAYAAALNQYGTLVGREEFDAVSSGKNWRQFLPVLMTEDSPPETFKAVALLKSSLYKEFQSYTVLNEGLVRLLGENRQRLKTALVTTASRQSTDIVLGYHRLDLLFDLVVTGDDVTNHKPHPEPYQLAARGLNVTPMECLAFEDSAPGVQSAKAFGCQVITVKFT